MKKAAAHTGLGVLLACQTLFISMPSVAQECYGIYGPPVWKMNFGEIGSPVPILFAGRTNCMFTTDPCPPEGFYTLSDFTPDCFSNSWYKIPAAPASGHMMIINAPAGPGDVYVDTIENLCGSTNYIFSLSVVNLSLPSSCGGHPIRPRFTFQVETLAGVVLATLMSDFIVESDLPRTNGFELKFRTPAGANSVRIRITDIVAGGCGNDFKLDDMAILPCMPDISTIILNHSELAIDLCVSDSSSTIFVSTLGQGYSSPAFQWQQLEGTIWNDIPGAIYLSYGIEGIPLIGTYKFRMMAAEDQNISNPQCRAPSNEVIVTLHDPKLTSVASSNGPVCENDTLSLSATGGVTYDWTGPDGYYGWVSNPSFISGPGSAGDYIVAMEDLYGCKFIDTVNVTILAAPKPVVSSGTQSGTQIICFGDSIALNASGGLRYSWLPDENITDGFTDSPTVTPSVTTLYTVKVFNENNCSDTANVLVVVNTIPKVSAGGDKITVKGQSVMLDGNIQNPDYVEYRWLFSPTISDVHSINPLVNPETNTNYILTAESTIGCGKAADTVLVKVFRDYQIPNAFSPNKDGVNDTWHIPSLRDFPNAVVTVYDRYGARIFESNSGNKDWDGKYKNEDMPAGAYPYLIDLKNDTPVVKGMVILVR